MALICTYQEYVELYPDPVAELAAVKAIITALNNAVLDSANKGVITEYLLDDTQIRIQRKYGTFKETREMILFYTQEANRLIAQIDGRQTKILPCLG